MAEQAILRKMQARLDTPVSYSLPVGDQRHDLTPVLGNTFKLEFTGRIFCVHCGRNTNKSFNQGYCYPCFQKLAQCDSCIISPEKCHYDAGTCREPIWGDEFCMQDHIVYLSNASGIKVGITRASQVPTRWIDQGAVQALPIYRVRSRQQSGFLEHIFRQHMADRTNWRAMLKGEVPLLDLCVERDQLIDKCQAEIADLVDRFGMHAISRVVGIGSTDIQYPVHAHPDKVVSLNPEKTPLVSGELMGIKGQYLILDKGVINIRKYAGYEVKYDA